MPNATPGSRYRSIDIVRGFAVMGILLMNIIAFSMPESAYLNPGSYGGTSLADRAAWAMSLILIDGKMRGLFSLLFGASMLILMDRTEMAGRDGRHRHIIRSFWLALIGLAHYLLLWWGDILTMYALVGLIALALAHKEPIQLIAISFLSFAVQFMILIVMTVALHYTDDPVSLLGLGEPDSTENLRQITLYRGDWAGMVADKASSLNDWLTSGLYYMGLEVLGFMLLGMAMMKSGFLTGSWPREQYIAVARHCLLIGGVPMLGLALWVMVSGFDTLTAFNVTLTWSFPFRIPLTVAAAALILSAVAGRVPGRFLSRVEAVGRMALSNYLGTSLLMTATFYGWGLGLFGALSRVQVYAFVPPVWAIMLLWSPLWLSHFRYGPAEWLWRSLTLFSFQPMLPPKK